MSGPDFSHVDSLDKAKRLAQKGELIPLLLLPADFGGEDVEMNVVYVPAFAAEQKVRLDQNVVMQLVREGKVRRYQASPKYEGKSCVPCAIEVAATDPGSFRGAIQIWGRGVQQASPPASSTSPPEYRFASQALLTPEETVRSFIADYELWNARSIEDDTNHESMDAMHRSEAKYAELIRKYCREGFKSQPISYGTDSSHNPRTESIVSTEASGSGAIVRTRNVRRRANVDLEDDYEYHLSTDGTRWYLESVLYVDSEGKYEGL